MVEPQADHVDPEAADAAAARCGWRAARPRRACGAFAASAGRPSRASRPGLSARTPGRSSPRRRRACRPSIAITSISPRMPLTRAFRATIRQPRRCSSRATIRSPSRPRFCLASVMERTVPARDARVVRELERIRHISRATRAPGPLSVAGDGDCTGSDLHPPRRRGLRRQRRGGRGGQWLAVLSRLSASPTRRCASRASACVRRDQELRTSSSRRRASSRASRRRTFARPVRASTSASRRALLVSSGQLPADALRGCAMAAELALDGSVRSVPGAIAMAERAGELGLEKIVVARGARPRRRCRPLWAHIPARSCRSNALRDLDARRDAPASPRTHRATSSRATRAAARRRPRGASRTARAPRARSKRSRPVATGC